MKIHKDLSTFKGVQAPVLTAGTFDGVHLGHQKILEQLTKIAKNDNGESVLLTFFPHPRIVLFPDDTSLKLINTQQEKIERLEQTGLDHLVICRFTKAFSRLTHIEYVRDVLVNQLGVKKVVTGYDHHFGRNREGSFDELKEMGGLYGFDVEQISARTMDDVNISSTKIRKALSIGDVETANQYLGYRLPLSGVVTEGEKVGRTIGYPTANLNIADQYKVVPAPGVYAVLVKIKGKNYKGMMNIGQRPTVVDSDTTTLEVNIFDFRGEIYGDVVRLEFIRRIRDEEQFDSLDALKDQLNKDKAEVEACLEGLA